MNLEHCDIAEAKESLTHTHTHTPIRGKGQHSDKLLVYQASTRTYFYKTVICTALNIAVFVMLMAKKENCIFILLVLKTVASKKKKLSLYWGRDCTTCALSGNCTEETLD